MNTDPVAGGVSPAVAGVAEVPEGPTVAGIADSSDRSGADPSELPNALDAVERKWKIFALQADVARTVAISIVGAALAAIFYVFQDNQTQSRYYSDLQAQRESADSALRAQMFTTLFQNYLDHAEAYVNKTKVKDRNTREELEPDLSFLKSIEEQIAIIGSAAEGFRQEVIAYLWAGSRRGDRISYRQVLRSVSGPKTTKLGTGRFWVIDVEYHNQNGDLVGIESYTGFGYRRNSS